MQTEIKSVQQRQRLLLATRSNTTLLCDSQYEGFKRTLSDIQRQIVILMQVKLQYWNLPMAVKRISNGAVSSFSQFNWRTGQWGACSTTCGAGIQTRTVECLDDMSRVVTADKCPSMDMPITQQPCQLKSCPLNCVFTAISYSPCSVPCGFGVQYGSRRLLAGGSACLAQTNDRRVKTCFVRTCETGHNLLLWLDATYGWESRVDLDAQGRISRWRDNSINLVAFRSTDPLERPQHVPYLIQSGKVVLRAARFVGTPFSGVANTTKCSRVVAPQTQAALFYKDNSAVTVFIVARLDEQNTSANAAIMSFGPTNGFGVISSNSYASTLAGARHVAYNTPRGNMTLLTALIDPAGSLTFFDKGTVLSTRAATGANLGPVAALVVGSASGDSCNNSWNGLLGEIMVFQGVMGDAMRIKIELMLMSKWHLGSHPSGLEPDPKLKLPVVEDWGDVTQPYAAAATGAIA